MKEFPQVTQPCGCQSLDPGSVWPPGFSFSLWGLLAFPWIVEVFAPTLVS